jgi:hypothetical protein
VAVDVEDEKVAALDGVVSVQIFIEEQQAEPPRPIPQPTPRK